MQNNCSMTSESGSNWIPTLAWIMHLSKKTASIGELFLVPLIRHTEQPLHTRQGAVRLDCYGDPTRLIPFAS